MTDRHRLWLCSYDDRALSALLGAAGPEDVRLLLDHVEATSTGSLEGDLELGERLDADPSFVADIVGSLARCGLSHPRPSDVAWRVVDDVIDAVLGHPSPALRERLGIEGESPDGFFDLSSDLSPIAARIGKERCATILFEGRRPGRPLGEWPGSQPYFLLSREEVGPFSNDVRAIIDALPSAPAAQPTSGLVDRARQALDRFLSVDVRALATDLLLVPLENASARDRAVYGRWD